MVRAVRSRSRTPSRAAVVLTALLGLVVALVGPAPAATPPDPTFGGPWIEQLSSYEKPGACPAGSTVAAKPGTAELATQLSRSFGLSVVSMARKCPSSGVATSEHQVGRAIDIGADVSDAAGHTRAKALIQWLLETDDAGSQFSRARRLGVMYIIYNRVVWGAYDPVWRPYTGSSPHTDHIHISLNPASASYGTSWWKPMMSEVCDPNESTCTAPPTTDVYTTPGHHLIGGREWRTTCEPYSSTSTRCFTDIKATQTKATSAGYVTSYDWAFNNLTYVDTSSGAWVSNPLARTGTFTSGGRQWKVTCTPADTGQRSCTAHVWTTVISRQAAPGGGWTYRTYDTWVFNNVVRLSA